MPLNDQTERALAAIAEQVRGQVAALDVDQVAAIRRLATLLTAPGRAADRNKVRERARQVASQGGRCAVCQVPFATSPPSTRGALTDRLVCSPCAREGVR
jgi:hypothetical protein